MKFRTGLWPVLFFVFFSTGASAQSEAPSLPAISIIIDDMGKRLSTGQRVLPCPDRWPALFCRMPGIHGELAEQAWRTGKEVMLHLPMDSVGGAPSGCRCSDTGNDREVSSCKTVQENLAAVPHVPG